MKPRRVVEDVLVPMTIVAPPPATVTQRTCLEHFGITPRDYFRFIAEGAFPITEKGKLRIAEYGAVLRYLTDGAAQRTARPRRTHRRRPELPAQPSAPPANEAEIRAALDRVDFGAARRKGGFRST
jgi:hypothetical protein